MRRVAFYAPMKSPLSPVPSGDRQMARNLIAAIQAGDAKVDLVSEFKSYDKTGDAGLQERLSQDARMEAERILQDLDSDIALWVTYHSYYKSPDLIGPTVCEALGIPYVQIESTRATSRLNGPWHRFAEAAHKASDAADAIFYLTANDLITLKRERFGGQHLIHLPPFLPSAQLPPKSSLIGAMLTAGMMREGDKLASYGILAKTLAQLPDPWQLDIAGDGPARAEVEALMAPFGHRVRFLGQLDRTHMEHAYARASLFVWPGVNEAFGMVYLEAQAAGVPVVAQDRPGVRDVLLPGAYPSPEAGPEGLARLIRRLQQDTTLLKSRGQAARDRIAQIHLRPAATQLFWTAVTPLLEIHS